MSVRVSKENFDIEVLLCNNIVVADFYSDSCVPCKRLLPIIAELEEENTDNIKFVKINVNYDLELAEKYGVQSTPTLIFFKNGEEKARRTGQIKKSEISDIINELK